MEAKHYQKGKPASIPQLTQSSSCTTLCPANGAFEVSEFTFSQQHDNNSPRAMQSFIEKTHIHSAFWYLLMGAVWLISWAIVQPGDS